MQANQIANIYQMDLDRHLYAFEPHDAIFPAVAGKVRGLVTGLVGAALASYAYFF